MDLLLKTQDLCQAWNAHETRRQLLKKDFRDRCSDELLRHLLTNLVSLRDHLHEKLMTKCKHITDRRELYEPFFAFYTTHCDGRNDYHSSFLELDGRSETLFVLLHHGDTLAKLRDYLGPYYDVSIKQETIKKCETHYVVRERVVLEFYPGGTRKNKMCLIPIDLRVHSKIVM